MAGSSGAGASGAGASGPGASGAGASGAGAGGAGVETTSGCSVFALVTLSWMLICCKEADEKHLNLKLVPPGCWEEECDW